MPRQFRPVALVMLILGVVLLVTRYLALDVKPAMHDESMFAFYAWEGIKPAGHYIHQAILHGPVQMLGIGWCFRLFGESLGSARIFIATWSVLMAIAGILLAPRRGRWWWAALWITSPIIIYYSRYLHEEAIFNGALLIGMAALARAMRKNGLAIIGLLLALAALMLLVAKPEHGPRLVAAGLLVAGGACGMFGIKRDVVSLMLAWVGAIGLFFPLAVKENALFPYASGFTFVAAWLAIHYLWRGQALGLSWLPARIRKPEGRTAKKLERAARRRGRKYMPPTFDEITTPSPELAAARQDADADDGTGPHLPMLPLGYVATGVLYLIGLVLAVWVVFHIYGTTRSDSEPTWPLVKIFEGALLNMRASWDYWYEQHKLHRIEGPISYYIPIMLVYELPVLLLLYGGLLWDALRRRQRITWHLIGLAAWLLIFVVWRMIQPQGLSSPVRKIEDFLHIKPNAQMFTLGVMIVPILVWSLLCLKRHLLVAGWLGWWAACSLFQYSSAGEKVPWLAVNIIVPLYMALAWVWAPHLKYLSRNMKRGLAVFVVIGVLIAVKNDVRLIGKHSADPAERIVYNHTPPEFDKMCRERLAAWEQDSSKPLKQRRVLLAGSAGWPSVWYFRNCEYTLDSAPLMQMSPTWDLVVGDKELIEPALRDLDMQQYLTQSLSLRNHWMVVWPETGAVVKWWNYYWFREMWPPEPVTWPVTVIFPSRSHGEALPATP